MPTSLTQLLKQTTVDIVDIGANLVDGKPPYAGLIECGGARVVGFEPNPEALRVLQEQKGPRETYLPYAVGDGQMHQLKLCRAEGMTSILEPNPSLLQLFPNFTLWGEVVERVEIATHRLDDIQEIARMDMLKIDIQGYELEVFRNGKQKLKNALVVHTEVEFLPLYVDQPLFGDVDCFLREEGFMLHRFVSPNSRPVLPTMIGNDPIMDSGQLVWADAIYIRDFTKFESMHPDELARMAIILHDIYGAWDLAFRAMMVRDIMLGTKDSQNYFQYVN